MRRRSFVRCGGAAVFALLTSAKARADARPLSVGVSPGPHVEIIEVVRRVAATRGLAIRAEVRDGGRAINADVASGALDVACFQDAVDFATEMRRRHDELVDVATTVTRPFAIYSRRLASLRSLGDADAIGIPREPGARARALILLNNYGLITLRYGAGLHAAPTDVLGNRRPLRLVELPSVQLTGALDRLACVVVDSPNASRAGLLPARDSIGMEDARTPYADVLAVRRVDGAQPWVATLVASYHSDEVKRFILERFQDSVRRPW